MLLNPEFVHWRQIRLPQIATQIRHRRVGCHEFLSLLLSRRHLERCNDNATHMCGLFDPRSGELFDVPESELDLLATACPRTA